MPREGVEPSCREAYDFESYVYTNSTTEAGALVKKSVSEKRLNENQVDVSYGVGLLYCILLNLLYSHSKPVHSELDL